MPEDSCAYRALRDRCVVSGGDKELWAVSGGNEISVRVEALPLSATSDGDARVLALLTVG